MPRSPRKTDYRLEMLQAIPAFHRRAREKAEALVRGELVYYGPSPSYYGIGEVKRVEGRFVAVDFRGTGLFGVHEDTFDQRYVIPIPSAVRSRL